MKESTLRKIIREELSKLMVEVNGSLAPRDVKNFTDKIPKEKIPKGFLSTLKSMASRELAWLKYHPKSDTVVFGMIKTRGDKSTIRGFYIEDSGKIGRNPNFDGWMPPGRNDPLRIK